MSQALQTVHTYIQRAILGAASKLAHTILLLQILKAISVLLSSSWLRLSFDYIAILRDPGKRLMLLLSAMIFWSPSPAALFHPKHAVRTFWSAVEVLFLIYRASRVVSASLLKMSC